MPEHGPEADDTTALGLVIDRLEGLGQAEEAITWLRLATEADESDAIVRIAALLGTVGRREEADQLRQYGIESGGQTAGPW